MGKRILVVDDSVLIMRVLCEVIGSDGRMEVADTCRNGLEAYERLKTNSYDAVLLDINMPKMNGFELLKRLKEEKIRATVIIVSAVGETDIKNTLQALELGAVDMIRRPGNFIEARGEAFRRGLIEKIAMIIGMRSTSPVEPEQEQEEILVREGRKMTGSNPLVAIACSTGGPMALTEVIPMLPARLNAPVLLVQHMPKGFTAPMAERLNRTSAVTVKEAEEGEKIVNGRVYVAPGGKHLGVKKSGEGEHVIKILDMPPRNSLKPCADIMYESLAESDYDDITCVVMTGMGSDGTAGIIRLGQKKNIFVLAQDEQTCVVYGMPRAVAMAGVANSIVPLQKIAEEITARVGLRQDQDR